MPFTIKPGVDVLALMRDAGYTSYRLRQDKVMGERVLQKLRDGGLPSWHELDVICSILHVDPWDIVQYSPRDDK